MSIKNHKNNSLHSTPSSHDSGSVLIESARGGDTESFNRLFRHYEDTIFSFAFKVCRDKRNAEETLQDTYVNVFRSLHQFDGRSKFSTWLYSIVANNCLMKRRRTKIEKHAVDIETIIARERGEDRLHNSSITPDAIPLWRNSPLDQVMGKELRSRLDGAIGKLPVDYRMVFILRDIEGKTAEETAKIVKISVPAVKSRLRRARVFLRKELEEYMVS